MARSTNNDSPFVCCGTHPDYFEVLIGEEGKIIPADRAHVAADVEMLLRWDATKCI